MKIAFASDYRSSRMDELVAGLRSELAGRGHEILPDRAPETIPPDVNIVFNITNAAEPKANYLRASSSNFVCTLAETCQPSEDLHREAYRVLIKTLSNLLAYGVHRDSGSASYLVTPELGFREVPHGDDHLRRIADQVLAISDVRFVIENELVEDLPPELHEGDEVTASMARIGRKINSLGLLPSVLPLDEILTERDRRMLMKVFGVKQLSYGNLSARRDVSSFWMTGRGVDKSNLKTIGKDILLVTGYDAERIRMRLSVPPGTDPTSRASVDAIEHYKIYREFPGVGAMIHVHAWLAGIESTLQNYPCGSEELADEVLALVRRAPDPDNAVVGLKNHGVTVTGPDLDTIYDRIAGRLERQVPMV
jgi:ribulose-5-phosphate 4-epimerase/fuculose-1-phosphate aldolase